MASIETMGNNRVEEAAGPLFQVLTERVKEAGDNLYMASKDKYDLKAKIIENATDMTTEEKLEALDHNYDRYTQEVWQGIIVFGAIGLGVIGLAVGNPAMPAAFAYKIRQLILRFRLTLLSGVRYHETKK